MNVGTPAFDATYGYDLAALRSVAVPEEPPGFAEFWTGLYARAEATVTSPCRRWTGRHDGVDVYEVEFTSLGDVRLGGWLVQPADGIVERALVIGHGYAGRAEPTLPLPADRAAAIFPCSRGLPTRGLVPGIPSNAFDHVLHGIADAATYVHAGCAADVWCAATALLKLLPSPPSRLDYIGASFGGGIGALALPWDQRFASAVLKLPSFGQQELRLTMPCTGSGESVRRYASGNPAVRRVLRYFDAAVAARRLRMPTLVAAALRDPAVPPPGQFAVYNGLPGERELFVLSAGHEEYPEMEAEDDALFAAIARFLS